jgi:hypothetical protein
VVGDLILDALHDFSGGGTEAAPTSLGTRGLAAPAASTGFVNPSEWGLDALFDEAPAPPPPKAPAPAAAAAPAAASAPGGAPAAAKPARPPAASAAQRARPAAPTGTPQEGGPFWKRWFGN